MSQITAQQVKELREKSGAGMMDCKSALQESAGDMEKAIDILRKKGVKDAGKRAGKIAAEGIVYSYIHGNGRVGVLLEMNSETDFVARGDEFQNLAKRIAMHIAWASPRYVSREEVPADVLAREQDVLRSQLTEQQQKMADKIIAGKLEKFYQENCLIDQIDAQEAADKKTISDLVKDLSGKLGEKIEVRRFVRYEVGEGIEKQVVDYAAEVAAAAAAVN